MAGNPEGRPSNMDPFTPYLAGFQVCEGVDRFASLNFSKSRTVTSVTVRNHFESMGLLGPCND